MRRALENIYKRIEVCQIGEQTEWKEGFVEGLKEAVKYIQDGIVDLTVVGNNYYVICYQDGDKHFPYVEEMRLYFIKRNDPKRGDHYYFSKNTEPYYRGKPDLILTRKGIQKRVFFLKEDADNAI